MCGIFGAVAHRGELVREELLKCRDVMAHRGPDDQDCWLDEHRSVCLAHRRLSIIDLSAAARQPMASADGAMQVVFNGEIYNFLELRRELEERGRCFRTSSDTEVILHAFDEWGEGALARFEGMFGLALFDARRRKLWLARDRFGEKPLYYYTGGDHFIFSSELKGIEAHPRFDSPIAYDMLSLYFIFGNIPYPHSIYEKVYKLPPAHFLELDVESRQCRVAPYWRGLDEAVDGAATRERGADLVDRVEEELRRSIGMRLVADVPVGAFLSGGVDSSLVVSLAARMQDRFKTFAIGFEDDEHDEAPYARKIAAHLGCEHYEHYITAREARETLVRLPDIYDEPYADSSAIPMYIVSRLARAEVKVVLSGDGGDELFGGYTTYPRLANALPLLRGPAWLRSVAYQVLSRGPFGKARKHAALLQCGDLGQMFMYLNERTIAKRPDVEALLTKFSVESLAESGYTAAFAATALADPLNRAMFADAKTYLVDDILTKVDRASMAVSLEARVPFLDTRLAELAMGLSSRAKMGWRRQQRKSVLRALLRRHIPASLFERPKKGFSIPLARWLREDLKWLVAEHLDAGALRREGLFNVDFVERLKGEHMAGYRDREAVLWALICWEMWRKQRPALS